MNANSLIEQIQNSPAAVAARDAYFAVAEAVPEAGQPSEEALADQAIEQQTARLQALLDRWEQRHAAADSATVDSYFAAHPDTPSARSREVKTSPAMS